MVIVNDVTPGGNAERSGFSPGTPIIDLTTTDGRDVERGEPIGEVLGGSIAIEGAGPWEYVFDSVGSELKTYDGTYRLPTEGVDSTRIATAVAGAVIGKVVRPWIELYTAIDRSFLEFVAEPVGSGTAGFALLIGVAIWRFSWRTDWRVPSAGEHAASPSSAPPPRCPALILPAVQGSGRPPGLLPATWCRPRLCLMLGVSLARHHPEPQWVQTGMAASLVASALAIVLVSRY